MSDTDQRMAEAEQLLSAGRIEEAEALCRQVREVEPDHPKALHMAGLFALNGGRPQEALTLLSEAAATNGDNPMLLMHLGLAEGASGRITEAVATLEKAVALKPDAALIHFNLGTLLGQTGDAAAAVASLRRAVHLAPGAAEMHLALGAALLRAEKAGEAEKALREAVRLKPDWARAHADLAEALQAGGEADAARSAAERALALKEKQPRAELVLARLDLQAGDAEAAVGRLEGLAESGALREAVLNDLGRALERTGEFAAAFEAFTGSRAEAAKNPAANHVDRQRLPDTIERNRTWYLAARTANWEDPPADDAPVFLVGFPSSGTGLLAGMLASHPSVVVGHREPWLRRTIERIEGSLPEALDDLGPQDLARLRATYREQARASLGTGIDGRLLIDRNPLGIVDLGAARRLFPEARVLVALREPRDTVLACFKGRFPLDEGAVHFLDLPSAAALYSRAMDLWLQYRQTLGLDALEFHYEDLVSEPGQTVSRIASFLGIDWQDQGTVLDDRGIDHWRKYHAQMTRVLPTLSVFVKRFGYDRIKRG